MTKFEQIKSDISALSDDERARLRDWLLDLVETDDGLEAAWAAESADRLAAYDRGEMTGSTLADFVAARKS